MSVVPIYGPDSDAGLDCYWPKASGPSERYMKGDGMFGILSVDEFPPTKTSDTSASKTLRNKNEAGY